MTAAEFDKFIAEFFVSYPAVADYINTHSPDPVRTKEIWYSQMKKYELAECVLVLDQWRASTKPPFEAYERDQVMHLLRASIEFERDKQRKKAFTEKSSSEYKKVRREDYRPLADDVPGLGDILRKGILVANRWKAGEIAIDERDRLQRKIIDESFK